MPLMTVLIATSPASPPNPLFPGSLCCSWSPVTVPELCKPASASGHWHLSSRLSFSRACTWILPQVHRSLSDTHSPESFSLNSPHKRATTPSPYSPTPSSALFVFRAPTATWGMMSSVSWLWRACPNYTEVSLRAGTCFLLYS